VLLQIIQIDLFYHYPLEEMSMLVVFAGVGMIK